MQGLGEGLWPPCWGEPRGGIVWESHLFVGPSGGWICGSLLRCHVVPSRVMSSLTLGAGVSVLQEIQSLLINWKGPDLTIYGELVLEGTFRVHRVRSEKTFFLFDKALLITKKRGDHFVYKGHIPVIRPPPSPLPPSSSSSGPRSMWTPLYPSAITALGGGENSPSPSSCLTAFSPCPSARP